MTAPFVITTLQQAMRAAWVGAYRGLASQDWRRAVEADECGATTCLWRTPCDDAPGGVLRCAVGWLIPDAAIGAARRRSGTANSFETRDVIAAELRPWVTRREFIEFLEVLQDAHDDGDTPSEMRANLERVRARFNLGPVPSLAVAS